MGCKLLGTISAYLVQIGLGFIAILSLAIKFKCEKEKRIFKVWILDVSKQIIGSFFAHFLNMLFAYILTDTNNSNDQCVMYMENYLVDSIFGLALNCLCLWILQKIVSRYNIHYLEMGKYIPDEEFKSWSFQVCAWILIIILVKFFLFAIIVYPMRNLLNIAGLWMLGPILGHEIAELIIVMILIPLICNVIQFLMQDIFLKYTSPADTTCYITMD